MIRFFNGRILSFGGGISIDSDEVWTEAGEIVYKGEKKADMPRFEREIDLKGDLLMPGFKNAHAHTAMTFLRSFADDMPLDLWLTNQVFPNEAKLDGDAVYDFTKLGVMEYLAGGITSCFDMYIKNEMSSRAYTDCGFRAVLCAALNDYDSDPTNIEREYLKFNGAHELVSYTLGIHAEYTTSMERMEYMAQLAEKYHAPCYMHCAETESEVQGCIERHGMTPVQLFTRLGMFKYGGGIFHGVWMNDEDIRLLADGGIWLVTNPASNLKLASGIAPLDRMRRAGVKLAIGTDGAASNNALDMFREMYLASVLQKYLLCDAAAGCAENVLEMACVGGARAIGLDKCDDLAVGKRADLIVIDLHKPNMQPMNNIVKNLVYAGARDNVRLTMVNGRILYENGEFFIGEKPEEIYRRAQGFMRRIKT